MIAIVADHLWQSTVVAAVVAFLTFVLRRNRPQVRYALWLAASVKFLVPFAALVAIGAHVGGRSLATTAPPPLTFVIDSWVAIGQPFSQPASPLAPPATSVVAALPFVLLAAWLCGCVAILVTWSVRWRQIVAAARAGSPAEDGREIEALGRLERIAGITRPIAFVSSEASLEPGVFGIWKPVLLWPRRITEHLDDRQLDAILAHEVTHVRRSDNLAAAVHMVVEAVFWFHPLVWWIGARLVDERERACDAEVIRMGSDPHVYAESILKTCQFYIDSPLVCVAGVAGSDLKTRIEQIMRNNAGASLNTWRKALLAILMVLAVAGPIAVGLLNGPRARAQSSPADALGPPFTSVSVKVNTSDDSKSYPWTIGPDGRFAVKNIRLWNLIAAAYQLQGGRLWEGPGWLGSDRFDIEAKADGNPSSERILSMVRRLLADRFHLLAHTETRELPIYALVVATSDSSLGAQLRPSQCTGKASAPPPGPYDASAPPPVMCGGVQSRPGRLSARWVTMEELADNGLSLIMGRVVRDRTGLTGHFDLDASWTPDTRPPGPQAFGVGPSTFVALEEQLGLRLAPETAPVDGLVIDRVEKPAQD
jgi:bla regulator protein BlaR1